MVNIFVYHFYCINSIYLYHYIDFIQYIVLIMPYCPQAQKLAILNQRRYINAVLCAK